MFLLGILAALVACGFSGYFLICAFPQGPLDCFNWRFMVGLGMVVAQGIAWKLSSDSLRGRRASSADAGIGLILFACAACEVIGLIVGTAFKVFA